MAKLSLDTNPLFSTNITVEGIDADVDSVYVRFQHAYLSGKEKRCDEMFLTPIQLELVGRFLVRQAIELQQKQKMSVI